MRFLLCGLTSLTLLGSACALNATTLSSAFLYAQPHEHGQVKETLARGARVDVRVCTGGQRGFCSVVVQGQQGWMSRRQLRVAGSCAALRAIGLRDIGRTEASYAPQRDRNRNGLACDRQEK